MTNVPKELLNSDENNFYIMSVIDHFSKFSVVYLISNKKDSTILNNIKKFIDKNGIPKNILTDNGKEFTNNKFKNYCKKKE